MSSSYVEIWIYARPDRSLTIEERHARFVAKMLQIGPPLGYQGLEPPATPDCGAELCASFGMKYPIRGLQCFGDYIYRGERYIWEDKASFDEHLRFRFRISNKAVDYVSLINGHLHQIVGAFESYRALVAHEGYDVNYWGGLDEVNPTYKALRKSATGVDGRSNIYTLYPAQFWDGELCQRALGFDRDEVIQRLKDVAVVARPVLDGVYLVLNDDPKLSYETYVEMNERIKQKLGLHYGPPTII